MATFNLRCPKNYPRRCNLLETEKEQLERAEKYTAFLMYQFSEQDDYLVDTIKRFFQSPTYYVFDAREEVGLGIKICKICRLVQASDFGIMVLTPENPNAYLETGMMMGMGKRNLYIASKSFLKSIGKTLKEYVSFDLSDQLVILHENKDELLHELKKEVPNFIENIILGTALEREQRKYWRRMFDGLEELDKVILKFLFMVSEYRAIFGYLLKAAFTKFGYSTDLEDGVSTSIHERLTESGILLGLNTTSNVVLQVSTWIIHPQAAPYIEEFLFQENTE